MFIIQDLEEYQHVMAKRTYTTEKAGPSTTNRFVQRTYTPTKVVTGATTKLADIQPDLTGKRKVIQPQDSAGGTPPAEIQDLPSGMNKNDPTYAIDNPIASYFSQNPPSIALQVAGVIAGSIDQGRFGLSLDSRAGNVDRGKEKATGENYNYKDQPPIGPPPTPIEYLRENKQKEQEAALSSQDGSGDSIGNITEETSGDVAGL